MPLRIRFLQPLELFMTNETKNAGLSVVGVALSMLVPFCTMAAPMPPTGICIDGTQCAKDPVPVQGGTCQMPEGTWTGRSTAAGTIKEAYDWESGNLSQCGTFIYRDGKGLNPPSDQVALTKSLTRQGTSAARFMVKAGDQDSSRSTIHLECHAKERNVPGQEDYYAFSFFIPKDYAPDANYLILNQFHSGWHGGANPQFALSVSTGVASSKGPIGTGVFASKGGLINWNGSSFSYSDVMSQSTTFEIGGWNDVIMHFIWSTDSSKGRVEIWQRQQGESQFKKTVDWKKATLYYGKGKSETISASQAYAAAKFGIYAGNRDDGSPLTKSITVTHDGFRRGSTLQSVASGFGCAPAR
jgi:hypothetical protein